MKQRVMIVWIGSIATLVLGALSGLALSNQDAITRVSMVLAVVTMLFSLFAIPFFLVALKHFKIEFKKAYIILCIGIGIFGLAQIQLPLINLYYISFWVDSGAIAVPYLIGTVCIFWSMRVLSRLLNVMSIWRSIVFVFLITLLVSFAMALLPHVKVAIDELSYHIAVSIIVWNAVFITSAAILVFKIRQKIGLSYTHAMDWLFRAFVILSVAGWHYVIVLLIFYINDWYYDYSIALIPFALGAFILIIAGFIFGTINTVQKTISSPSGTVLASSTTLSPLQELEVVSYVTNLASNPSDIDNLIGKVHLITTKLKPGQTPTPEDQKELRIVYTELEDYLLHQDPLRVFTSDELHRRIARRFGFNTVIKTSLWRHST